MQADKINPGQLYAIHYRGKTVRFHVQAIETVSRRTDRIRDKSRAVNYAIGHIPAEDLPPESQTPEGKNLLYKVEVAEVSGPYEEFAELKARKDAEDAALAAKIKRETEQASRLYNLLYELTGLTKGENESAYRQPFQTQYGGTAISIQTAGVAPLLQVLENIK